ncbi:hypothetical protein N9B82_05660, partial [Saprospiraceae bacterium]|nr:hypothetical protein [Saprospiraceae bacterium]
MSTGSQQKVTKKFWIFFFLLLVIFVLATVGVLSLDNSSLSTLALSVFPVDSDAERAHIQQFLTEAFFTNLKTAFTAFSILVLLGILCVKRYSSQIFSELSLIRDWSKCSVKSYGSGWFYSTTLLLFLIGLFVIPLVMLNSDEAYAFEYFTSRNPIISLATYPAPNNHVFFSFWTSIIFKILPFELFALRLPSLSAFIASFLSISLYNSRKTSKIASFLSIIGVFCCFYPLFYAVQGRGYSFLLFFSTILTIIAAESIEKKRLQLPIFSCMISILGFYTIPVFLYPFGLFLLVLALYIPFKSVLKLGAITSVGTIILYMPIIALFGEDVLINNEFVVSLSLKEISNSYLPYITGILEHHLPIAIVFIAGLISLIRGKFQKNLAILFLIVFLGSLVLPLIQRTLAPPRVFIYLYPLAVIVFAHLISKEKWMKYLVIPLLIYNIYFLPKAYYSFNSYSID